MNKIDVTMTATIRPRIIDKTLSSFTNLMLTDKSRYRLIINIDPIGEDFPRKKIIAIVRNYFDDVIINIPDTPSFCKAVIWCWSQTSSDYVFHLEDDWQLLVPINIDDMINILETHKDIATLRLSKDLVPNSKISEKFGFTYYPKISLNPTLFRGSFIKRIFHLMDPELNPEKQLRATDKHERGKFISKIVNGIYTKVGLTPTVMDIGRDWMNNSQYVKETGFLEWKKKEIA